jgi:O-acetyl-ADP-ribose deacetylase (regulator of RNase III)
VLTQEVVSGVSGFSSFGVSIFLLLSLGLAFPAISAGAFGYPAAEAARIALSTVLDGLPEYPGLERVRFVLFDAASTQLHQRTLDTLSPH